LTITVHPFAAKDGNMAQDADRKQLPAITDVKDPGFDAYQTATLKNGTKVLFARRTTTPIISVTVGLPLGSGHDPANKSGLAALTANLLDEGAGKRDATAIAETAESLGANLSTGASATHTIGSVSSLTGTLDASLDLLGDVLRNPTFPAADFERLRRQTIDGIKRQKVTPAVASTQALRLAFGEAHPFGRPATEASLAAITLDDVKGFYAGADLSKGYIIVTGDTTLEAVLPKLDARFGNWAPAKPAPAPVDFTQVSTAKPAIYLIDRPNAPQSQIVAINTVMPFDVATEADVEMANKIFGGAFISRLNMNLREDKGWSYGARSGVAGTFGPRAMTASAGVQSDKTKESLVEMRKELSDILGGRPITQTELADAVGDSVKALPGQYETAGAVAGSLQAIASRNLPGDYYNTYTARLRGVTLDSVNKTAKTLFKPNETIYVIAGDRAKVEPGLSELAKSWNIPLMHIDADGKPVK
ncbi:MAG: M16 family metallopeptidase, partial [Asticcacaulis sp.]